MFLYIECMENFKIRKYTTKDKQETLKMFKDFYDSPAVLHKIPHEHFEKTLTEIESKSPFLSLYIFEKENQIAGYSLLAFSYSNEAGGNVLWIDELYLKENYRAQGIATLFFGFLKENFKNCTRFRLEIDKRNIHAENLYKRLGFEFLDYKQYIQDFG